MHELKGKVVCGIYAIRQTGRDREYIGSAFNIWNRWLHHRWHLVRGSHHSKKLQGSWNKYGAEAFELVLLEVVEDQEQLRATEQRWIDDRKPFFNSLPTVGTWLGASHTPESRAKMSAAQREIAKRPEMVAQNRAKMLKLRANPEATAKWREAMKARIGTKASPEACANISAALKGKKKPPHISEMVRKMNLERGPMSEEQRKKISASMMGRVVTPEMRQKMSRTLTGHEVSAETRAKIGAANRAAWARKREEKQRALASS